MEPSVDHPRKLTASRQSDDKYLAKLPYGSKRATLRQDGSKSAMREWRRVRKRWRKTTPRPSEG